MKMDLNRPQVNPFDEYLGEEIIKMDVIYEAWHDRLDWLQLHLERAGTASSTISTRKPHHGFF